MTKKSLETNIKIFPFYRAFSYDVLFLWTISIMYLTWKGLSYAQTIYLDAVFMISAFITQIPMTKVVKKIGRANSIRLAGLFSVAFSVILLLSRNFWWFVLANVFYGLSAAIKNIADTEILALSLKRLDRSNEFSKIEGKGTFWHYFFESIAAISSGYMFEYISPYAPVIATLTCNIILVIFALVLKDPKNGDVLDEIKELKEAKIKTRKNEVKININANSILKATDNGLMSAKVLLDNQQENNKGKRRKKEASYKDLLKDKFVISMVIFCFCFYGIMSVYSTLAKVYYQEIGVQPWVFGYIYFVFKMVTAFCSKYQFKFEHKKGVQSLIIFSFLTIMSFGLNGIMASISYSSIISIIIITSMFIIQNAIRAPYRIFVKNYINISCDKNTLPKVLTLYGMAEYLGFSFITLTVAVIMDLSSNNFGLTNLIITGIVAIPMFISIVIFIRELIKKYTKKHTIIRPDIKEDL